MLATMNSTSNKTPVRNHRRFMLLSTIVTQHRVSILMLQLLQQVRPSLQNSVYTCLRTIPFTWEGSRQVLLWIFASLNYVHPTTSTKRLLPQLTQVGIACPEEWTSHWLCSPPRRSGHIQAQQPANVQYHIVPTVHLHARSPTLSNGY